MQSPCFGVGDIGRDTLAPPFAPPPSAAPYFILSLNNSSLSGCESVRSSCAGTGVDEPDELELVVDERCFEDDDVDDDEHKAPVFVGELFGVGLPSLGVRAAG